MIHTVGSYLVRFGTNRYGVRLIGTKFLSGTWYENLVRSYLVRVGCPPSGHFAIFSETLA